MKRSLFSILSILIVFSLVIFLASGCSVSDGDDGVGLIETTARIGPDGGTIKLENADGAPEIEIPPGTLSSTTTVKLRALDIHIPPENENLKTFHPVMLELDKSAIVDGSSIIVRFNKTPAQDHVPGIGHFKDKTYILHPADTSYTGIEARIPLNYGASDKRNKTNYAAEYTAVDMPLAETSNSTPTVKISKMANNQWVEDEGDWEGTKIALLVHGITGSSAKMLAMGIHLDSTKKYDAIYAVDYKLGYRIDSTGSVIADIIKSRTPAGIKIDVLAHSMGGVVARSSIENHGADAYTNKLITTSSPHNGVVTSFLLLLVAHKFIEKYVPEIDDLAPNSAFIKGLNNGVAVNCYYYAAVGTDGEKLTEYWTFKDFGKDLATFLLGGGQVDGMVNANSSGYDISAECLKWESQSFPVSHEYIKGGEEGSQIYTEVFDQIDKWIDEN